MSDQRVAVTAPDGARAVVHTLGAQVESWVPAGGREQLFTATHAPVGEKAFKGGVPICFPQFGGGPLPQHGFARDLEWAASGGGVADGIAWSTFRLGDAGALAGRWPHAYVAELRVSVDGARLEITLDVENAGARAWYFTGALHTYLRVDDIGGVTIDGLGGREFIDKTRQDARDTQAEPLLRIAAETDRIYPGITSPLLLRHGARELEIAATGFSDVVVWNPWEGAEAKWPQFAPLDYRHMVCIEAAVAVAPVSLEKGQRWSGSQILTSRS